MNSCGCTTIYKVSCEIVKNIMKETNGIFVASGTKRFLVPNADVFTVKTVSSGRDNSLRPATIKALRKKARHLTED